MLAFIFGIQLKTRELKNLTYPFRAGTALDRHSINNFCIYLKSEGKLRGCLFSAKACVRAPVSSAAVNDIINTHPCCEKQRTPESGLGRWLGSSDLVLFHIRLSFSYLCMCWSYFYLTFYLYENSQKRLKSNIFFQTIFSHKDFVSEVFLSFYRNVLLKFRVTNKIICLKTLSYTI